MSGPFRFVSSSASVVLSEGAVVAERSPLVCEGELCGVSSSVTLRWNGPYLLLSLLLCTIQTNCDMLMLGSGLK